MKLRSYALALTSTVISLLISQATMAEPGVTCSSDLQSDVPLLNTALHNIYSFDYIRKALSDLNTAYPHAEFCVSGMAVSRDIYQYPEYFVQVEVRLEHKTVHELRFLFQDASVQALDNTGDKPWIGLPLTETESELNDYVMAQNLQPAAVADADFDVLAVAKSSQTYAGTADIADSATLSILPIHIPNNSQHFYIVSWLTKPGNNPFASFVTLKAVLIARNDQTGEVSIGENLWLTNSVIFPLQSLVDDTQVSDSERAQFFL